MASATFTEPIPERRRTRFAPNGGPRPTAAQRRAARRGLEEAREQLASTAPGAPKRAVVVPMTAVQRSTARTGIEQARRMLLDNPVAASG